MELSLAGQDTPINIMGPEGTLEAILTVPAEEKEKAVVVICHPHPLYEGTMHNKVVHTMARTFRNQGMHALRFNFRGVGQSEGRYGESIGEIADALAVVRWVQAHYPSYAVWLAGFSFGGYVAYCASSQEEIAQVLLVAPSVEHFPIDNAMRPHCPVCILQGEDDEVVPAPAVNAWAHRLDGPVVYQSIAQAGHFFHGQLKALQQLILDQYWGCNAQ